MVWKETFKNNSDTHFTPYIVYVLALAKIKSDLFLRSVISMYTYCIYSTCIQDNKEQQSKKNKYLKSVGKLYKYSLV